MIPSRPLYLGDIIGNTFLIASKTWTRSAAAAIFFMILPMTVILVGATGFISTAYDALEHEHYLTPEKLEHFRRDLVSDLRRDNPSLLDLYGIPEVSPDTAHSLTDEEGYYDTERFNDKYGSSFSGYIYWAILAYILLILASLAYQVASVDLACREFEERKLDLGRAIKDTLRKYLWVNILQFLILIFVLAFGLGVAVQIGELLHPTVGAGLVLGAVIMTVVTTLRLLFAQPALVSENLGPLAALKRSWEITKGNSWRIFGTLIVFALIMITIYLILSIPLTAITSSSTGVVFDFLRGTEVNAAHIFNSLNALVREIVLVMLLTTAVFASLSPSFLTVFYYDLRTRKDGPLIYHDDVPTEAEPKPTS